MKRHYGNFLVILIISIFPTQVLLAQTLTGPSFACRGSSVSYIYDDKNAYCENIEWELYENGVRKTTGFSSPSPGIMNVVWNSGSGTGEIKARGYSSTMSPTGSFIGCGIRHSWRSITVSFSSGEPLSIAGPAVCGSTAENFTIQTSCTGVTYDWEAPANWNIDGGSNILNGKSGTTVSINAPASGTNSTPSQVYTIRARVSANGPYPAGTWVPRQVQLGPVSNAQVNIYKLGSPNSYPNMCPNTTYTLIAEGPPGTTFTTWSFVGGFSSAWGEGNIADVTTSSSFNGGFITVNGYNNCGSFSTSRTIGLSSDCPYYFAESDVLVYPNPSANDEVTVSWPASSNVYSISLVDKHAQNFQTVQPSENQYKFDLSKLKKGEYFLHIYVGKAVIRKRFIKN